VDSLKLARKLDQYAAEARKKISILLQVDLAGETAKFGIPEEEVESTADGITGLSHLSLKGLMIIPPFFEDPESARPYFIRLRTLFQRLKETGKWPLTELSMGMSADYEVAVEEGATLVRVGTAIFGPRP
jgi:pyridoxal phosphate enzyme (YggS family)